MPTAQTLTFHGIPIVMDERFPSYDAAAVERVYESAVEAFDLPFSEDERQSGLDEIIASSATEPAR